MKFVNGFDFEYKREREYWGRGSHKLSRFSVMKTVNNFNMKILKHNLSCAMTKPI
jgi:hypothetical protein